MSRSTGGWDECPLFRREQITGITGGQIVALTDAPLFTSASTPWAGFLLEAHTARGVRQDVWWSWYRTHVCVITSGILSFQVRYATRDQHFQARTGNILLFPRGFGEARFSFDHSDFQLICVELDRQRAARLLRAKSAAAEGALVPQFDLKDPHIGALLRNMAAEVAGGCAAGKLYGQSLSLALAAYLEGRFSAETVLDLKCIEQRFSRPQIQRLVEYIHANLAEDLSLHRLADLVDMSPRHFFRLFANTFGSTPHRFIVSERVTRAKELLANGLSPIEVVEELGFVSQSHLTDVFRKATGTTPGLFRREHRPALIGGGFLKGAEAKPCCTETKGTSTRHHNRAPTTA